MANSLLGEIEIKLAERTFTLRPTFEAITEMEERSGCTLARLMNRFVVGDVGVKDIAAIVYGCMLGAPERNAPIPSFGEVGMAIMNEGFTKLFAPCGKIIGAAYSGKPISRIEVDAAKKKGTEIKAAAPSSAQEP